MLDIFFASNFLSKPSGFHEKKPQNEDKERKTREDTEKQKEKNKLRIKGEILL